MADPTTPWWRQAAAEIWGSRWTRGLAIILIAFEIYNTAILPAVRGTIDIWKLRAEAMTANQLYVPFNLNTEPPKPTGPPTPGSLEWIEQHLNDPTVPTPSGKPPDVSR